MRTISAVIIIQMFAVPAALGHAFDELLPKAPGTVFTAAELLVPPPAEFSPEAKRIVSLGFGLPRLGVAITEKEARRQELLPGNSVPFEAALTRAMESFLADYSDEESPLSLVIDEVFTEEGENAPLLPYPARVVEKAGSRLRAYLDRESTELRLLAIEEQAEHGERTAENWIFFLWIPDLSDHGHWAVISRSGGTPVYNYGFN